jgi:hypothetical protein
MADPKHDLVAAAQALADALKAGQTIAQALDAHNQRIYQTDPSEE